MFFKRSLLIAGTILAAAVVVSGCDGDAPTRPSPLPDVTPPPSSPPPTSRVIGTWNLTVRVIESTGPGCVADTLRADIDAHNRYSLSIVETGEKVEAILASESGDFVCAFPARVDSTGFTEAPGYYTCEREKRVVSCDGSEHPLVTFGQSLESRFSGSRVSGEWGAFWEDLVDGHNAEMEAEFTGTRQ